MFDFESFIQKMRETIEKQDIITAYENFCGPIKPVLEENEFYTGYISKFKVIPYKFPEECAECNYPLLLQLTAGSFSSNMNLFFSEDNVLATPDLNIFAQSGESSAVKSISDLWSFQIIRFFEIYICEQLSLQTLFYQDPSESSDIFQKRQALINQHNEQIDTILSCRMIRMNEDILNVTLHQIL